VLRSDAEGQQARWGCPAAGHRPPATLEPDLRYEDEGAARVMGTPAAGTCPFACLEAADPWVDELTRAVSLRKLVPDLSETLGRPLASADLDALHALTTAQNEAAASDRDEAERKRAGRDPGGPD
jgi:hypothetical protein